MKNTKVRMLVEGAVMVALATVLSYIRIVKLPWGGSVTLLSMLPIILYSIKYGVRSGLFAAFVFSLFQLGQGFIDGLLGWGLTPVMLVSCILLDYVFAYTSIGLGGAFREHGTAGYVAGTVLAVFVRFLIHVISGVVIWHSTGDLWSAVSKYTQDNEILYSVLYNGAYMLPEMVFTTIGAVVLFKVPVTKKLLTQNA